MTEAEDAELAEHYARILGQSADRRVSAVIRTCLRRLPSRLPVPGRDRRAVEGLIERVLRLGEVGSPDLVGSPREIDDSIARRLGEPAGDPRSIYRALHAMLGRTALVERHSRQTWALRLSGLTDSASEVHRALVAETPALYCLPAEEDRGEAAADKAAQPHQGGPNTADPGTGLHADLARLQAELTIERQARAEFDERRRVADAELDRLRQLDEARINETREQADVLQVEVQGLEQELAAARRREQESTEALAEARRELDNIRRARATDAATVQQMIEARRIPEAATYSVARMLGLDLEGAAQALFTHMPPAATEDATISPEEPSGMGPAIEATPLPGVAEPASPGSAPASAGSTEPRPRLHGSPRTERPLSSQVPILAAIGVDREQPRPKPYASSTKIGRNASCPCGSGKKFKRCCGQCAG